MTSQYGLRTLIGHNAYTETDARSTLLTLRKLPYRNGHCVGYLGEQNPNGNKNEHMQCIPEILKLFKHKILHLSPAESPFC